MFHLFRPCVHQEWRKTWLLWGRITQSVHYYTIRLTRCTSALYVMSRTTKPGARA